MPLRFPLVALACGLSGCGLTLDYDPRPDAAGLDAAGLDAAGFDAGTRDAGAPDAGSPVDCTVAPDGAFCAGAADVPSICSQGQCVASICGDGVVDARNENCEGESAGCAMCKFVCVGDADCAVGALPECTIGSHCDLASHTCVLGLETDGTPCSIGRCVSGVCSSPSCGDGSRDSGEDCDDGNAIAGDGCEPDCTESCSGNEDCNDRDPCTGVEQCVSVPGGHACMLASEPEPIGACEICVPLIGVITPDRDGDTFADANLVSAACARRDCNDADPRVFPGATELCNRIDDDCDMVPDDGLASVVLACAPDRDGDGFPVEGTIMTRACGCGEIDCSCSAGSAQVRTTSEGTPLFDCFDEPGAGANVHPGQLAFFPVPYCVMGSCSFDYNCDGSEDEQITTGVSCTLLALPACRGDGWQGSFPACGETGTYATCSPLALLCRATTDARVQSCR